MTKTKWAIVSGGIAAGAALIPLIPLIKRRARRVTTILKKDHRVVRGMIAALQMTPRINRKVRETLFEEIRTSVLSHAQAEEEVLYPAMRTFMFQGGQSGVEVAYREHQHVKDLLNDLKTMDPMTEAFDTKFADFKGKLEHHVEQEENEMFRILKERMSLEQQEELGQRALERMVREARSAAKPGDVFTPEARPVIKRLLAEVFGGPDGKQLRSSIMDENQAEGAGVKLAVNARYPDTVPLTTIPPQLLQGLPKLTEDLEYRFVGDSLILLDVHAHVIVDFVEDVLPD